MTSFRMSVTVLAVMHALFAGFTALAGAFANGVDIWQRLLVGTSGFVTLSLNDLFGPGTVRPAATS